MRGVPRRSTGQTGAPLGGGSSRPAASGAWGAASAHNLWSGLLFGVGLVAFVDEVVFHQILQWHHFYDRATPQIGLVSDGVFHAISWAATVCGLFLLADIRRRHALHWLRWWGGALVGAGAFQLYDGVIQHKLLGIHQIRYVPDVLSYDLAWNAVAVILLLAGATITIRTRRDGRVAAHA